MPVNYQGVATATQSPSGPPNLFDDPIFSLPVDLTDDVAAASVAQAFKTAADYITLLKNIARQYFGDGSDGDVTISSGTTVLTGPKYYNNLTISGGELQTRGWPVYVKGVFTWSGGKISCDGANGAAGTFSAPGHGGGHGNICGPHQNTVGGPGGVGAVAGGDAINVGPRLSSGAFGAGVGGGSAGSTAGTSSKDKKSYRMPPFQYGFIDRSPTDTADLGAGYHRAWIGGPSGSGGGGAASKQGGCGGQGGGCIYIAARSVVVSGAPTASAIGGNGGAGEGGGGATGGGGGGVGGYGLIVYGKLDETAASLPAITTTVGTAGAGGGGGSSASPAVGNASETWIKHQVGS